MEENKMIKYGKYGWVDLSNLEKRGSQIYWEKSIGKTIEFQYDDIHGFIVISGYHNHQKIYINIDGYVSDYLVNTITILKVYLGNVLHNPYLHNFKYEIGDVVNDTMLITDRYRDDKHKKHIILNV